MSVRLVYVLTVAESVIFIRSHAAYMRAHGLDVHVVAGPGPRLDEIAATGVTTHESSLGRSVVPTRDVGAVIETAKLFRRLRPDVVHAGTPKGGLVGMIAAALTRVPARIYQIHGLPHLTERGPLRAALRAAERTSCRLAHRVLCASESNRRIVVEEGFCAAEKLAVIGSGSAAGVDARGEFDPDRRRADGLAVRRRLGIPERAPVVGFVGRLATDKGIDTLTAAWRRLRDSHPDSHLIVVGGLDARQPPPPALLDEMERDPRVHATGAVERVAAYYAAIDVLALPTLREGFGNVCLEAAAMAIPVVATRVPGVVDAVIEGRTGALVPVRDAERLAAGIARYLDDPALRGAHGEAGRAWALEAFVPERISAGLHHEYLRLADEAVRR